jgi:protein O-GlcNAc transferase
VASANDEKALIERAFHLFQTGDAKGALGACVPLLKQRKPPLDILILAGILELEHGDLKTGLGHLEDAWKRRPGHPDVALNLGVAYDRLSRHEDAVKVLREALGHDPRNLGLIVNLTRAQLELHDPAAAEKTLMTGFQSYPDHPALMLLSIRTLARRNRVNEAELLALKCKAAFPGVPDFDVELALVDVERGQAQRAFDAMLPILEKDPGFVPALAAAASAAYKLRDFEAFFTLHGRIPKTHPLFQALDSASVSSELLSCEWNRIWDNFDRDKAREGSLYDPFVMTHIVDDPALVLAAANWTTRKYPSRPQKAVRRPAPGPRKLRIGYLSTDYKRHPVGFLMTELIRRHDRSRFEVIGLSLGLDDKSPQRRFFETGFDTFIDLGTMDYDQALAAVRAADVDVLVDLNGHTAGRAGNLVAAYPAPIQVTWLGYPGTFGGRVFDYTIADSYTVPNVNLPQFSEKVVRLPDTYQVNSPRVPSERVMTRAEFGLPEDATVFCSFNDPRKIQRPMIATWAEILHKVPGSVMWIFVGNALGEANVAQAFAEEGIAAERVIFAEGMSLPDHFRRLELPDLFVDTYPYSAHTTCSDMLYMGLPVLTLPGVGMGSRVAASLVTLHGFPELVASDRADYVARAVALGSDLPALKALRRRILEARDTSRLFDYDRFARHMEKAFETMVEIARAGQPPRHFDVAPIDG